VFAAVEADDLPAGRFPGASRQTVCRSGIAVTAPSPTVRQRELGTRLRELRNARGLTVEDVAERLLCSPTKISRAETGQRTASLRDVRDLCLLYGITEAETSELMALARMARESGWWKEYSDLKLEPYIGLEQEASAITAFSMYYVPALLQTKAYATSMIKAVAPRMDPKVHDQRIEARLRRQQLLLQDNPPRYRVLLDEAVFVRRVGGSAVMAGQLDKILQLERDSRVTLQVIPFEVGAYAASDSNFVLLDLREPLSAVVFVEGLTGNHYHEKPAALERYRESVEYLRDSALSPRDSVALIARLQESYVG
jgi:transcriptional regulator with XRE-family HTH domain